VQPEYEGVEHTYVEYVNNYSDYRGYDRYDDRRYDDRRYDDRRYDDRRYDDRRYDDRRYDDRRYDDRRYDDRRYDDRMYNDRRADERRKYDSRRNEDKKWHREDKYSSEGNKFLIALVSGVAVLILIATESKHREKVKDIKNIPKNTKKVDPLSDDPLQLSGETHVMMTGSLKVLDPCGDPEFGVETNQPYLERQVEYYCW